MSEDDLFETLFGEEPGNSNIRNFRKPENEPINPKEADYKILKIPSSNVLSFGDLISSENGNLNSNNVSMKTRVNPQTGEVESNARLVQWDDGSWSVFVGSECYKIIERNEPVHIYQKLQSVESSEPGNLSGNSNLMMHVGMIDKQWIITPASLESRTHKLVTEKTQRDRLENSEKRKTQITSTVSESYIPPITKEISRKPRNTMSAAFLEEQAIKSGSVKALKAAFKKRPASTGATRMDNSESDISEYENDDDESDKKRKRVASGSSSDDSSYSSSEGSSSDDSSDSGSSSNDSDSSGYNSSSSDK